MDWGVALRNWRRVYDFLYRELMQAENKYKGMEHGLKSDRVLHEVLHDLNAGYTSTICKPGGLVDFRAHELRTLGVASEEIEDFEAFRQSAIDTETAVTPGAGWRRLLITSKKKSWGSVFTSDTKGKAFQKELEKYSCHCMCYQKSGMWTLGTRMSAADRPTCTRAETRDIGSPGDDLGADIVPALPVHEISVKVPGEEGWKNLGKAYLKLKRAPGSSSCRVMLEWELVSGKQAGVGYISPCKAPKPLHTGYLSTPSHDFEIVVYNPGLDQPHVNEPLAEASEQLWDDLKTRRKSRQLLHALHARQTNRSLTAIEPMT
jgi:hypothetical protein